MQGPSRGMTLSSGTNLSRGSHLRSSASLDIQKGTRAVSVRKSMLVTCTNLRQPAVREGGITSPLCKLEEQVGSCPLPAASPFPTFLIPLRGELECLCGEKTCMLS